MLLSLQKFLCQNREKFTLREKKKLRVRKNLTIEEFEAAILLVPKPSSYDESCIILALFFLSLIGLRACKLLRITVAEFEFLLDKGSFTIGLIDPGFLVVLTEGQYKILKKLAKNYDLLLANKNRGDLLFSGRKNFKGYLYRHLDSVLKDFLEYETFSQKKKKKE